MRNSARIVTFLASLATVLVSALAQGDASTGAAPTAPTVAAGPFAPTWESLSSYGAAPDWFRDAKFGIWAHWGPQCQPEQGDWYARFMYMSKVPSWARPVFEFHRQTYGHQSQFGFKDVINSWKAENWDPEKLMALYKRAGAQYFFALANHHDNFDLWDSKYQPWNSVRVGPRKDIIAGWAKAARAQGLRFGVSVHAAHAWTWYEPAQGSDTEGEFAGVPYDGKLTAADGAGKWWEGLNPQELYAQNHPRSAHADDPMAIHRQWDWGDGASIPDAAYCEKFLNRTLDLIDTARPDLVYFDDTALPLWPVSDVGLKIAAHFYNRSLEWNGGWQQAVLFGKILTPGQKRALVWDVERGAPNTIEEKPWQTCTCIGEWHYRRSIFEQHRYKGTRTVLQTLADVVSKNGNLLLSIPVRGDGTLDPDELALLEALGRWMDINRECIFSTRPWKVFGEGPSVENAAALTAQGFNEGKVQFGPQDIRFTTRTLPAAQGGGTALYAIFLGWPDNGELTIHSLAAGTAEKPALLEDDITAITLLGSAKKLEWARDAAGLRVVLPVKKTGEHIFALKITTAK
jgi:alpha-L-fucosidase